MLAGRTVTYWGHGHMGRLVVELSHTMILVQQKPVGDGNTNTNQVNGGSAPVSATGAAETGDVKVRDKW